MPQRLGNWVHIMAQALPFAAFIAPARRRPQVWRLLLGLLICALVSILWIAGMFGIVFAVSGIETASDTMLSLGNPSTPRVTFLLLSTFGGMALAPMVAVWLLHKRGPGSLFGPATLVLRHFAISVLVTAAIYGVTLGIWSVTFDGVANVPLGLWVAVLPLSLLGIALQTGAEEILFRGYILQQLAARFASPLVYMLVPSLMFGALHYDPGTMGTNAWAVVGSTAFFGLIAADLTHATGSLGAAWGLHFANNIVAILVISTKGTITGLSLYLTPYAASEVTITGPLLLADLGLIIVVWGVLRWILRR